MKRVPSAGEHENLVEIPHPSRLPALRIVNALAAVIGRLAAADLVHAEEVDHVSRRRGRIDVAALIFLAVAGAILFAICSRTQ